MSAIPPRSRVPAALAQLGREIGETLGHGATACAQAGRAVGALDLEELVGEMEGAGRSPEPSRPGSG